MRRVFITGVNSFVGQEVVGECLNQGIEVFGLDLQSECPKIPAKNFFKASVLDGTLYEILPNDLDAIIHLAALSRDSDCKNKGFDTFNTNVLGTLRLMDAAQKRNCKQFIFASSEWVYGNFKAGEIKDESTSIDVFSLSSEYAFSKVVSEINLKQKFQHGFCDTTILRFGIIYGPRDSNWSAVESLFDQAASKNEISVGSVNTARCFIHVNDVARGILASIGLKGLNTINIEGERLISLGEVIEKSAKIFKTNPRVIETQAQAPNIRNVKSIYAENLLNWKPKWSLEQGLGSLFSHREKKI